MSIACTSAKLWTNSSRTFADDHRVTIYGDPSPQLVEMANAMMAGRVKWYSFLQGI